MKMEELGIDEVKINEVIEVLRQKPQLTDGSDEAFLLEKRTKIKEQIALETDWKKKAALQARLIVMDFEA